MWWRLGIRWPDRNHRWLVWNTVVGAAFTDFLINAAIAKLGTARRPVAVWGPPLVGGPSFGTNTLGMLVLLPMTTSIICRALVEDGLRRGRLTPMDLRVLPGWLRVLPRGRFGLGVALGAAALVVIGPGVVAVSSLGPHQWSPDRFSVSQGLLGALLGVIVTPIIALAAMTSPERSAA